MLIEMEPMDQAMQEIDKEEEWILWGIYQRMTRGAEFGDYTKKELEIAKRKFGLGVANDRH